MHFKFHLFFTSISYKSSLSSSSCYSPSVTARRFSFSVFVYISNLLVGWFLGGVVYFIFAIALADSIIYLRLKICFKVFNKLKHSFKIILDIYYSFPIKYRPSPSLGRSINQITSNILTVSITVSVWPEFRNVTCCCFCFKRYFPSFVWPFVVHVSHGVFRFSIGIMVIIFF